MFEDQLDNLDDDQTNSNAKGSPANSGPKKRRGKVVDQPEPEHNIKTEAKSEEDTKDTVKLEIVVESGESTDSLVKVKADTDIKIKPELID